MPSLREKMLKQLSVIADQEEERLARQKARLEPLRRAQLEDYHLSVTPGALEKKLSLQAKQKQMEEDAQNVYRLSRPKAERVARNAAQAQLKAEQDSAFAQLSMDYPDEVAAIISEELSKVSRKQELKDHLKRHRREQIAQEVAAQHRAAVNAAQAEAARARQEVELAKEAARRAEAAEALAEAMAEQIEKELTSKAEAEAAKKRETTRKRLETMRQNKAAGAASAAKRSASLGDPEVDSDVAELESLIAHARAAADAEKASADALLGDTSKKRSTSLSSPVKTRGRTLALQSTPSDKPAARIERFLETGDPGAVIK